MYTILAPLDNDVDRATNQREFISELPSDPADVRIVLTHILEAAEREAPESMQRPDRVQTVKDVKADLEAEGYDVDVVEASTPPAEGILDLTNEVDSDLVVMGGRKRSPAGKALFGSVTQSVILDSEVPVVVAGDESRE
ncbi:universal stress protein [Haloarculaceae archaeon H-GB2-1]|nr:universal stress protein [Haloarculaceae archaeon H-GB1-1]MEA5408642.1 universal stress protein [Haloarculaceae archaeon H-GB2-1]